MKSSYVEKALKWSFIKNKAIVKSANPSWAQVALWNLRLDTANVKTTASDAASSGTQNPLERTPALADAPLITRRARFRSPSHVGLRLGALCSTVNGAWRRICFTRPRRGSPFSAASADLSTDGVDCTLASLLLLVKSQRELSPPFVCTQQHASRSSFVPQKKYLGAPQLWLLSAGMWIAPANETQCARLLPLNSFFSISFVFPPHSEAGGLLGGSEKMKGAGRLALGE